MTFASKGLLYTPYSRRTLPSSPVGRRIIHAGELNHDKFKNPRQFRIGSAAVGANALGALAVGAFAIGALAIGRLVVGLMAIGKAKFKSVEIDELTVRRLQVLELTVTDKLALPTTEAEHR